MPHFLLLLPCPRIRLSVYSYICSHLPPFLLHFLNHLCVYILPKAKEREREGGDREQKTSKVKQTTLKHCRDTSSSVVLFLFPSQFLRRQFWRLNWPASLSIFSLSPSLSPYCTRSFLQHLLLFVSLPLSASIPR